MDNLFDILEGTPWWVYVLFIYLLSIGIKASRPRGITLKQMMLLPAFLTAWSLYVLFDRLNGRYEFLALWAAAAAVGFYVGICWVKNIKFSVDKVRRLIYLKGNWATLILILAIFFIRYTFGYLYTVRPELIFNSTLFSIDTCSTGLIVGFFLGRSTAMWIRYQNSIE